MKRSLLLIVACLLFAAGARADVEPHEPGAELRFSLLTMSPGDIAFTKFGHNALLVENTVSGETRVYNYGTFIFDSPWLAVAFLRGSLRYWLSVSSLPNVLRHYAAENRSITAQELRIPPLERERMARFLRSTERSDARYYKYDYYRDNCSTRVRDVLDRAVSGRLSAVSGGRAPFTYRQETLRLTADDVLLALGLDLAMGPLIDRPLTVWESEFLPERLQAAVRDVRVPGPQGEVPLVATERVILPAAGRTPRPAPPRLLLPLLAAGLACGTLLASLGLSARRGAARAALAVLLSLLGFAFGLLGCVVVGLLSLTDHAVTYFNANVLLATPWSIALPWFFLGIFRGDERALRRAGGLVRASLATSVLVLVFAAMPFYKQKNSEMVAFFLPLWLGATVALTVAKRAKPLR
jgi:hypothetical protein